MTAVATAGVQELTITLGSSKNASQRSYAANRLGDLSAGLEGLLEAVQNDAAPHVRGASATALGKLGNVRAVGVLVKTLEEDQDPIVRGSAAKALGAIGDKAAVPALVKTLEEDKAPDVRGSAANALGAIGDKAAVPALVKTLEEDQYPIVRGSAANALGAIGDKAAVPALVKTLEEDQYPIVRGSAANALGAIGDKAAVPALVKTLEEDKDPMNRGSAANALGAIGDKAAVPALVKTLEEDKAPDARGSAANALGAIGDKAAVPALVKTLEEDQYPSVRGSAANALGAIGDNAAVPALVKTLEEDQDPIVRGSAAKALGLIEDKSCAPVLKAVIERSWETARIKVTAVSALIAVDPDSPEWLLALAQKAKLPKEVRGRIVAGLTSAPLSPAAVEWLRTVAQTDHYYVSRTEAVRGLAAHGALDEKTAHLVLDPSSSDPQHGPDWGARGQVAAAVVRAHAARAPLGVKLFPLIVQHLTAPDVPANFVGSGLAPLAALPLSEARTILEAFDESPVAASAAIAARLDNLRERVALETQAEAQFGELLREPHAPLRRFRARIPALLLPEKPMNAVATLPVALLITAVGSERAAVLELLRKEHKLAPTREEIGGRYVNRFPWPGRGRTWDVFLGQPTEKGGPAAQSLLQDLVRAHRPEIVLMVGMCGGFPENGAKEGTVILARQVFNYEHARLREGVSAWSPTSYRSTPRLLDLANALAAEGALGGIELKTTKDYASGDKLIDDLGSDLRQKILAFSGDILGFEMEAPDLLHAAWELGRTMQLNVAVAKGVSDFGDGKLRADKENRQRIATQNAAQVALKLLAAF